MLATRGTIKGQPVLAILFRELLSVKRRGLDPRPHPLRPGLAGWTQFSSEGPQPRANELNWWVLLCNRLHIKPRAGLWTFWHPFCFLEDTESDRLDFYRFNWKGDCPSQECLRGIGVSRYLIA